MNKNIEFPLSRESFTYMKMLANRVGIDLSEYQEEAIYNRLIRRLRILKLTDFEDYCQRLRVDIEEEEKFINLITNLTTSFFRENHHFQYLAHHLLPSLVAKKNKIRIWSAGCSTGEEPYSIAMVVREAITKLQNCDVKILATDVNSDALLIAQRGIYDMAALKKMSLARQKVWFHRVGDKNSHMFQVDDSLKELITFRQLNLMDIWPMHGPFDIIFCRNVVIYFKPTIRDKVLEKFDNLLEIGGVFISGYSETLQGIRKHYIPIGKTIYKKVK